MITLSKSKSAIEVVVKIGRKDGCPYSLKVMQNMAIGFLDGFKELKKNEARENPEVEQASTSKKRQRYERVLPYNRG